MYGALRLVSYTRFGQTGPPDDNHIETIHHTVIQASLSPEEFPLYE